MSWELALDARRLVSTLLVAGVLVIGLAGPVKIAREQLAARATATTSPTGTAGPAVHMAGLAFAPDVLTVAKGAEVQLVNDDTAPHTVTADAAGGVDSGTLAPGSGTFRLTVDQGFAYHCAIHPSMTAEIRING